MQFSGRNIIFTANLRKKTSLISALHAKKRLSALDISIAFGDIMKCNHPAMKYLMIPTSLVVEEKKKKNVKKEENHWNTQCLSIFCFVRF